MTKNGSIYVMIEPDEWIEKEDGFFYSTVLLNAADARRIEMKTGDGKSALRIDWVAGSLRTLPSPYVFIPDQEEKPMTRYDPEGFTTNVAGSRSKLHNDFEIVSHFLPEEALSFNLIVPMRQFSATKQFKLTCEGADLAYMLGKRIARPVQLFTTIKPDSLMPNLIGQWQYKANFVVQPKNCLGHYVNLTCLNYSAGQDPDLVHISDFEKIKMLQYCPTDGKGDTAIVRIYFADKIEADLDLYIEAVDVFAAYGRATSESDALVNGLPTVMT